MSWILWEAETVGLKMMRLAIWLVTVVAVAYSALSSYKGTPDFGADLFGDYGPLFMTGFAGHMFNDLFQRFAGTSEESGVTPSPPAGTEGQS